MIDQQRGRSLVCVPALCCLLWVFPHKGLGTDKEAGKPARSLSDTKGEEGEVPMHQMVLWVMDPGLVLFSKQLMPSHSAGLRSNQLMAKIPLPASPKLCALCEAGTIDLLHHSTPVHGCMGAWVHGGRWMYV